MDDAAAPFFSGVHLPWAAVPGAVRGWVEATVGPVLSARDLAGGFSPGCCTWLELGDGRAAFVKAVGAELNPHSPLMHRREARIAAAMPESPHLPRFVAAYDDGGWVALLYEAVRGVMPRRPWREPELRAVLDGLRSLHESLTPCPVPDVEATSVQMAGVLSGWRALASMPEPPAGVDGWALRHLERLVDLEVQSLSAVDEGDTLVHGDVRSDNVLLSEGVTVFIDWPHASRGSALFDLAAWAPSVVLEGGPDPEDLLARYGPTAAPDPLTAIVAGIAGYFTFQATKPPEPGLPTLRSFQDAQGRVTRDWLRRRTGWR